MKNELLQQLQEKIDKKLEEKNINVIEKEELYNHIIEKVVSYVDYLSDINDTISVEISKIDDKNELFDVKYLVRTENSRTTHGEYFIVADVYDDLLLANLRNMLIDKSDNRFFKETELKDEKLFLLADFISLSKGLEHKNYLMKLGNKIPE